MAGLLVLGFVSSRSKLLKGDYIGDYVGSWALGLGSSNFAGFKGLSPVVRLVAFSYKGRHMNVQLPVALGFPK